MLLLTLSWQPIVSLTGHLSGSQICFTTPLPFRSSLDITGSPALAEWTSVVSSGRMNCGPLGFFTDWVHNPRTNGESYRLIHGRTDASQRYAYEKAAPVRPG